LKPLLKKQLLKKLHQKRNNYLSSPRKRGSMA
jgi:hypothetical protein